MADDRATTQTTDDVVRIAGHVHAALEAGDLRAFQALLDPDVHWGAPGDPTPACRNRDQVIAWYERGRDAGVRASVEEVEIHGDRILVGLVVRGAGDAEGDGPGARRWQVLTVRTGRVVDIVGYESRDEALARARVPVARRDPTA
jgi:ketosteroid isomerase-like protein